MAKQPKPNSPQKAAQIFDQVMKLSVSGNPKPTPKLKEVNRKNLIAAKFIKRVDEKTGIAHYIKGIEDVWFDGNMVYSEKSKVSEIREMLNR